MQNSNNKLGVLNSYVCVFKQKSIGNKIIIFPKFQQGFFANSGKKKQINLNIHFGIIFIFQPHFF